MSEELGGVHFECERNPPEFFVNGFALQGGNVSIELGYGIYPIGVILVASVRIGDGNKKVWRRFWAPRGSAVQAAESLVYDCEEYLMGTLRLNVRETEDLDVDDFVHHLDMRINNGLH